MENPSTATGKLDKPPLSKGVSLDITDRLNLTEKHGPAPYRASSFNGYLG